MYPFIHLAEGLDIPTYFLVISVELALGLFWLVNRARKRGFSVKVILDLSLVLMVGSLVGSRLFHIFYENWDYYVQSPEKVFFLWDGGFVFYGGAFGALLFGVSFLKIGKLKDWGRYFDLFAPVFSFLYLVGRLGCFLAGCCYGRACDLPWAVRGLHPTQLYAVFWELGVLFLLLGLEGKTHDRNSLLKKAGSLFCVWVILHTIGRIVMESFRDDFRGAQVLGLSVSTQISLILLLIALGFLFAPKIRPRP